MTPRQQVYDAIKNARAGISTWTTLPYEQVEYRFALAALRPLAPEEPLLSDLYLRHRQKFYVAVNPGDWTFGYTYCLAKINGRVALADACISSNGEFRINGHRRQANSLLAIVKNGHRGLYRRDTDRCIGTNKPMIKDYYLGAKCPECNTYFTSMEPGHLTPAHFAH